MSARPPTQFHEVQALRQWHARIILAFPPAAVLFIGVRQLVFHHALERIRSATPVQYDPVGEYGGYGIRSGPRGLAYIANGNRAVQLELKDGRKLLIGSQRSGELAQKIMQAKG